MPHIAHDTPRMRDTSRKRSTPQESKNKKGTLACSSLALTTAHCRRKLCESLVHSGRSFQGLPSEPS